MTLEKSLRVLVEKLRERIDNHGNALRQSEALTRYALIDPLLRELDWDTADPDLVIPEYKTDDGPADYALLRNDEPLMIVEAKKLGTSLRDRVLTQGLTYCQMQGTRYCSVTDGRRWEIYDTHNTGPKDEKRIVEFDLKSGSAAEVCLKALVLWKLNVEAGHIGPAQAPVVEPAPNPPAPPEVLIPQTPPQPAGDEHEWQLLSELKEGDPYPVEISFPDASVVQVTTGTSLLVRVACWLISNNHLTPSQCPVRWRPGGERYIVHTEPVHGTGKRFRRPSKVGSLYVDRVSGTRSAPASLSIIEHVGQDPTQFKVRFS